MAVQNSELYQIWARRITLATTLIVVVLSWIKAVSLADILIRGGVSFGVMYLLMVGSVNLFVKMASQEPETEQSNSKVARGGVVDFSVGDDELRDDEHSPQIQPTNFPGQVDPKLSQGLPDSQQQAEVVRRMGWD